MNNGLKNIIKLLLGGGVIFIAIVIAMNVNATDSLKEPARKRPRSIPCNVEKILGSYSGNSTVVGHFNIVERAGVTLSETDIKDAEKAVYAALQQNPKDFILKYLLARLYFIWGGFYADIKQDKGLAKNFLEKGLSVVEESIGFNDRFSDSYRLSGDIYGMLIDMKSAMVFGPIYGPKADKLIKKAQSLNPQNPDIYLAMGKSYLYTPVAFGGSKKKAINSFEKVLQLCPDYYQGYLWLGKAHLIRGENDKAMEFLQKALKLAPDNRMAREELKRLK